MFECAMVKDFCCVKSLESDELVCFDKPLKSMGVKMPSAAGAGSPD
jgi:hypothetical protein